MKTIPLPTAEHHPQIQPATSLHPPTKAATTPVKPFRHRDRGIHAGRTPGRKVT